MIAVNFNSKAATLALATVVAALAPVVNGYFSVCVEIGQDLVASVEGMTKPSFEIMYYRVWTLDDDGNEINIDNAYIDIELLEATVAA